MKIRVDDKETMKIRVDDKETMKIRVDDKETMTNFNDIWKRERLH
jgi:hypothetical protein